MRSDLCPEWKMSRELFEPIELSPVSSDILHTKFLPEEICETILNSAIEINSWEYNPRLVYHTDDIHFEKDLPGWYDIINTGLQQAFDVASKYWDIESAEIDIASMFAVRYHLEGKLDLRVHHDDSYITGSIKLNNEYSGGELFFPKQKFTNKNIEVGDLLLWPGQITHPHGSLPITEGEKYSITIWTKNESLANHR